MTDSVDLVVGIAESINRDIDNNPFDYFQHLPGAQEKFHNDPARVKGLMGGNRSGKTEEGAHYMIDRALKTPKGRGWCACPSNELSIEIQQRKIWELIPKNQIKYGKYDPVNGFTHNKLILKNDFVLLFKSYEQGVQKFQSDDIDAIWLDEEPIWAIYQECLMRLLDRGGELIFTLTPRDGVTRFIDEVYIKQQTEGGRRIPVYMLNTLDNIHLKEEDLEEILRNIDEEDKPAKLCGIPVNKEGLVYPMFRNQFPSVVSVDLWAKVRDRTTRFTAIDPHPRSPTAVACYGIDRDGRTWAYDGFKEHLLIPELAKRIGLIEETPPAWRVIDTSAQIEELSSGKSVRMQLFEEGIITLLAKKDHKNQNAITFMRRLLTPEKEGELPMFVVVESFHGMIQEFLRYSWAPLMSDKLKDVRDPRQEVRKKDDHYMDDNHYLIRSGYGYFGDDRAAENYQTQKEAHGAYENAKAMEVKKVVSLQEKYSAGVPE